MCDRENIVNVVVSESLNISVVETDTEVDLVDPCVILSEMVLVSDAVTSSVTLTESESVIVTSSDPVTVSLNVRVGDRVPIPTAALKQATKITKRMERNLVLLGGAAIVNISCSNRGEKRILTMLLSDS